MRTLIAITLLGSVAFAATINEECKSHCMKDCLEVATGNLGSTNCLMMFGMGPERGGWKQEGVKTTVGRRSLTCQESCGMTCGNLCKGGNVATDRYYGGYGGYYGYGYYG